MKGDGWRHALTAVALLGALAAPVVCVAQYEAVILHSVRSPYRNSLAWGAGDGQQVGLNNILLSGGGSHALLWTGSAESLVDLHPVGYDASYALGAAGGRQVGMRDVRVPEYRQLATMWFSSPIGWVDLHPPEYAFTRAEAIAGDQQVGSGSLLNDPGIPHALLWRGSASSVVDLNPPGYDQSRAHGTDGVQQVGWAGRGQGARPALWSGTPESFVELTPTRFIGGAVYGIAGGQQVGAGNFEGNGHALLWFGSAASFVDLNPGPNQNWGSGAFATSGKQQVGFAAGIGTSEHVNAAVWSSTPESYLDLHQFLPPEFQGQGEFSQARGIDAEGNIAGYAFDLDRFAHSAVLWRPIPEPHTLLGLAFGLCGLLMRRRKR